jgi:hypothetical protein
MGGRYTSLRSALVSLAVALLAAAHPLTAIAANAGGGGP